MAKKFTIHGKKSKYGNCGEAPVCTKCDTGKLCRIVGDTHFCGWYKCPEYVGDDSMNAYRTVMNVAAKSR